MFKKSQQANVIYKVESTSDMYYTLGGITGNRRLKKLNVERIKDSMLKRNFLNCIPIIVDKKGRIIDGQHRYESATSLGIPIYVVMVEDEDVGAIAIALNTNKSNWTLNDFARYWAEQEDDPKAAEIYKTYLSYHGANHSTHGVLIAIFNGETSRHFSMKNGGNKEFKEGRLPFGNFNRNHIEATLFKLREIKNSSMMDRIKPATLRKQQFQEALLEAFETPCFNYDRFIRNLCCSKHQFNQFAKKDDMFSEIMRIHNKKVKK
tara:strand:- start:1478 stop:2266 length:789 start_codon:yes stop_codon:yes gene_type:complete